jgi:peptidoglycan/xylan/chitin deacetylase (PgdA/CDA1 family)
MRFKKSILILIVLAALGFAGFFIYSSYRVPIIVYHSIGNTPSSLFPVVSIVEFKAQMEFIKNSGYKTISFDDYCKALNNKIKLPHTTVVITFDDGYKDNLEAVKAMKQLDFAGTIFLVSDYIDKPGFLSKQDLNWISNNTRITIGSHTVSHVFLPKADDKTIAYQVFASKAALSKMINKEVLTLAYPIGGFDKRAIKQVFDAGYLCACTTNRGYNRGFDKFAIRRIKVTNQDKGFSLYWKLSGYYNYFRNPKTIKSY